MVSIKETFCSFCNQTSLHGWQFLGQHERSSKSPWQVFYWLVAVTISLTLGITYMICNIKEYNNAVPITSLDNVTIPLSEIYFPSVAVCNINQVRQSYFEEFGSTVSQSFINQVYYKYIEGKFDNNTTYNNTEVELNILRQLDEKTKDKGDDLLSWNTHQNCNDMLLFSTWNGSIWDDAHFDWDTEMDYGICCYYSPQLNTSKMVLDEKENNWGTDDDWGKLYKNMPKGAPMGKENGFSMLFDVEIFDYGYRSEISEGLKMELVKHYETAMMRQTAFHLSPGTENQIAIKVMQMSTSAGAISRFTPEKRNCYTENESILNQSILSKDDGYLYSLNNCLYEAAIEHIWTVCKCYPRKFIYATNHSLADEGLKNCHGEGLNCMNREINYLGVFDSITRLDKKEKCRPNCEEQVNSMIITSSVYPNGRTFGHRKEFCILCNSIFKKCNSSKRLPLERMYPGMCTAIRPLFQIGMDLSCNDFDWTVIRNNVLNCTLEKCVVEEMVADYARENLILANIFMKNPFATRFLKDEKYGIIDYVAKSGGLLGLAMGFSVVSFFEIIFYLIRAVTLSVNSPHKKLKVSGSYKFQY